MIAPDSEAGFACAIAAATTAKSALNLTGYGSKAGFLRPVVAGETLSTRAFRGVSLYAPKELVLSARSGTPLAELETTLAASGQHLIAEPPRYGFLGGADATQSFGGVIACNLSGPRRIAWGAMRDHVLGVRAITGRGEIMRSGGRVLKNVTGLDLAKLLTGSYGTLALLTEITVKVLPIPEETGTLVLHDLTPARAVAALSAALGSPFSVTGAAYLPERAAAAVGYDRPVALIRIEDVAASVAYRLRALSTQLSRYAASTLLDRAGSLAIWQAVRDATPLAEAMPVQGGLEQAMIWRVSVAPSHGPDILGVAQAVGLDGYLDWGGGLLMLAGPASHAAASALTAAVTAVGGGWWLLRAPEALRTSLACVPEEPPALAAIRGRLQTAFDPAGIFSPGKLHAA
jgi:glycolate oxidase FAD binding subunit